MPFPYQASGAPVRTRKVVRDREKEKERDKDARSTASSSGKKPKETARSSTRSPSRSSRQTQSSLYTQTNVTLDQLPPLPRSETASPSSTKSPVLRASSAISASSANLSSSGHLYTPASLQPYLEDDNDDDPDNATTPHASSTYQKDLYFDPPPTAAASRENPAANQTTTSTAVTATAPALRSPSPPPQPTSPPAEASSSEIRRSHSHQLRQSNQPVSPVLSYIASPRPYNPVIPSFGVPPSEPYPPYQVPAPQYFHIPPNPGHPMDVQHVPQQPFYGPYGSPQQTQAPFNSLRSPPIKGHGSTSSGVSFSGDQPPGNHLPNLFPGAFPGEPVMFDGPNQSGGRAEDDAVLQRIQSAIPDLHHLLSRYRETSGQLSDREVHLREAELHKTEVLKEKDNHIQRLTKELDDALKRHRDENNRHAEEKSKLRLEIGNMTEKHNELQENLQAEKKRREETEIALHSSKVENGQLIMRINDINRDLDKCKTKTMEDAAQKEKSHQDQLQRQIKDSETSLQARLVELRTTHTQEKDSMQKSWDQRNRELEAAHSRTRSDMDKSRESLQRQLDEKHKQHVQDRENWSRERDSMTGRWEEERTALGKGSEEHRILASQHQREKEELQRGFAISEDRLKKAQSDVTTKMQARIDKLKAGWDTDKDRFNKAIAELRASAAKINDENTKLQKLAQVFGEVTDLKSREDPYFNDAFNNLHRQISDVAQEHFSECPARPPNQAVESIPEGIPSFLSDTKASSQLRVAYVKSLISSVLTRRIFQHFLFTHPKFDRAFNEWAEHIRSKSTKREALWRQYTLHAAFTCPSSKRLINNVAAAIVEDIVISIRDFASRTKWDNITAAVRRIVKTAAETWRYASLELPRITVSENTYVPSARKREVLLSLFPRIEREGIHVDMREASNKHDQGCVYSPGYNLYTDSLAVLTRKSELGERSIGLSTDVFRDDMGLPKLQRPVLDQDFSTPQNLQPRPRSPLFEARQRDPGTRDALQESLNNASDSLEELNMNENKILPGQGTLASQMEVQKMSRPSLDGHGSDDEADASSPIQSPADSRKQSPTLSRRSTATGTSTGGEDNESESTPKAATLPNWGNGGGKVPGAF